MSLLIEKMLTDAKLKHEVATKEPKVAAAINEVGYGAEKMNELLQLHNAANSLYMDWKKEHGEEEEAVGRFRLAKAEANTVYMKHVRIARLVLQGNRGKLVSLDLIGKRKRSNSGWLKQSQLFYHNTLNDEQVLQAFAEHGLTKGKLEQGLALVNQAELEMGERRKEKGEAQDAIEQRDKAIDELGDWLGKFKNFAQIALEDRPQYLEMLGIVVSRD